MNYFLIITLDSNYINNPGYFFALPNFLYLNLEFL